MKKLYENPTVEIATLAVEDVVTTSSTCASENACPWDGGAV